ncbi:MAG: aldo/keto reductase [Alphaproteobacteria bacterium]|nr:aldo/keto reductase [Alphaproteobacteria bacterium]
MDKRPLGHTGIDVSPLGLGTVKFGRNEGVKYPQGFAIPGEAFLADFLTLARDMGVNLIDTAPAYGESEVRLGRLLRGQREKWVIAGKAGEEFTDGVSAYDFSPSHFEESLTRSLKRLNTDYLDVFLIHSDGRDEEILGNDDLIRAMQGFKDRGMVRAVGASTKSVAGGLMALELLDVVMATYNPSYTDEMAVLDQAYALGKGCLIKKALASGHVDAFGGNPVEKAMDFALSHPGVSSVIVGTISPVHLDENIRAAETVLAA